MGLCENMRQGNAGAFRAGVGVLLLGLSLAQTVPQHTACPAAVAPQNLTQLQNQDTREDTNAGFMASFVQSFLHTVQSKPFPVDLVLKIVKDAKHEQVDEENIKEFLVYRVGFLVCAAIGVLYIVLMPIVGFFLACCRCCDNCGGKMYQKQTSSIHCRRRTLYWCAFITTVIILAGNICMFRSNQALKVSMDQSTADLIKSIDNINTFLTSVPKQIDYVLNESYKTIQEVNGNLLAIGHQLGTEIQNVFRAILDPALHSVKLLDQETVNIDAQLKKLNSSLVQLQSSLDLLHGNVSAVKRRISQTSSNAACIGCNNINLQRLDVLDITISTSSLTKIQSSVDKVMETNLKFEIKEVEDYFHSIPQTVTNDTADIVQNSQQLLNEIKKQISQVTSDIPLSALNNVLGSLHDVQRKIGKITPEVKKGEHIRWAVCVVLCCFVLLVVVCNLLGLALGPMGLKPKENPTKRSCTADCGGTFFMMGAGFSFVFSWLLMIVVLVLFILGGSAYTLICKPWNNGELFKIIDTPGLIPGLEIGPALGLKTNLSISDIYKDCKKNQALWTTLHLNEVVNLNELLNMSQYTKEIQQYFDGANITLTTITLLSPEIKNELISFSATAKDFDFAQIFQQMNNISSINLNTTADILDRISQSQNDNQIKNELQTEARDLRQIQSNMERTITPQLENLNSTIKSIQSIGEKINGTVGEVLSNVEAAHDFLDTNTTQIIKTESRKFLDCQLGYFNTFAKWANITITQQVGRCGPVAGSVDSVENLLCANIVESLNAFWFSLGWCIIFFIPSIIFTIKLAKYYRKMKSSDVFDDHIMMNHFPRAQMKIT
ncbi:prominin-2 [Larimichthys crocea]|uniref:prominin-2 n=1 Tax=Larimichthys crocea TaxID=215358 RepID=UPI000F5E5B2C|nr:prominin-1-A [Larimichthys crocea]